MKYSGIFLLVAVERVLGFVEILKDSGVDEEDI